MGHAITLDPGRGTSRLSETGSFFAIFALGRLAEGQDGAQQGEFGQLSKAKLQLGRAWSLSKK